MGIEHAFDSAAELYKSFRMMATKAAAGGGGSGAGPYAVDAATQAGVFGQSNNMASAAKQYAALRDIPYTAIRPIAVKVASQPVLVGYKATAEKRLSPDMAKLRTKSLLWETAPYFMRKQIAEGLEPEQDHVLLDAFEDPNEFMTGWALRYCTAMSICATGDAFWQIDRTRPDGRLGFWYLPKTWVTPVHTPERPFAYFKVQPPGSTDELPPVPYDDMLHFRFPDPSNPLGSMSPLQSQARAVNTDDEIQKSQFASMKNGVHPSVVLRAGRLPPKPGESGQGPLPVLTAEQRRQLIDAIRLHYSGATHFGDPIIVDGMIEGVEPFGRGPADLDFPNGSKLTKDRIMQGIGTNPVMAGQIEGANRASSYVAQDVFYAISVNPILTLMSETKTARLARTDTTPGRKLYIWLEEAKANDEDLNLAKMTGAQTAMAVTKNEWREFVGLPKSDDPEADKLPVPPEPPAPAGGVAVNIGKKKPAKKKPKPGDKPKPGSAAKKKKRIAARKALAHDFFVKGLISALS